MSGLLLFLNILYKISLLNFLFVEYLKFRDTFINPFHAVDMYIRFQRKCLSQTLTNKNVQSITFKNQLQTCLFFFCTPVL